MDDDDIRHNGKIETVVSNISLTYFRLTHYMVDNTEDPCAKIGTGVRYDPRHGVLILFSLETYNLYSIDIYIYIYIQLKRPFDPMTFGISPPVLIVKTRA